jgi:trehalose-phosphatase
MYVGDDTTDEDAFRALRETDAGVGVVVRSGDRDTRAEYRLDDTNEVLDLLVRLPARLMSK